MKDELKATAPRTAGAALKRFVGVIKLLYVVLDLRPGYIAIYSRIARVLNVYEATIVHTPNQYINKLKYTAPA